jgi:predicted DNA-binding transcriptional regulator AlpA
MRATIQLGGQNYESAEVLAERFGTSYSTIWKWQKSGLLPKPIRLGGRTFYNRQEVEARILALHS